MILRAVRQNASILATRKWLWLLALVLLGAFVAGLALAAPCAAQSETEAPSPWAPEGGSDYGTEPRGAPGTEQGAEDRWLSPGPEENRVFRGSSEEDWLSGGGWLTDSPTSGTARTSSSGSAGGPSTNSANTTCGDCGPNEVCCEQKNGRIRCRPADKGCNKNETRIPLGGPLWMLLTAFAGGGYGTYRILSS